MYDMLKHLYNVTKLPLGLGLYYYIRITVALSARLVLRVYKLLLAILDED